MSVQLPQEMVDSIIDSVSQLAKPKSNVYLRMCSLVARSWVYRAQHHLFRSIVLHSPGSRCHPTTSLWKRKLGTRSDGPTLHVAHLTLERISSQEFRDFAPCLSTFRNLKNLSLRCWDSSDLDSRVFLSCFLSFAPSLTVLTLWCARHEHSHGLDLYTFITLVNSFPHLERLSLLNFHLHPSPKSSPKPRTRSSFTGELRIAMFTNEDLVLLSRISWKPRGLALEYTGHPITSFDGIVSSCGKHLQSIEVDSHTYGRSFDHTPLSWSIGSDVGFVIVLGKRLLESCLTLTDLSFYYHDPKSFDNQTSRLIISATSSGPSVITFIFRHDIIRFSEFLEGLHVRHPWHEVDGALSRLSSKRSGTPLAVNVLLDYAKCGATVIAELQDQIKQYRFLERFRKTNVVGVLGGY